MADDKPRLLIEPPLLNSANPWATTLEDLEALWKCKALGAVTTRTALLQGFNHDQSVHQYAFFDPATQIPTEGGKSPSSTERGSLNTLGYSPLSLETYLSFIQTISDDSPELHSSRCFIVSVTGSPDEVVECYRLIADRSDKVKMQLAMEVNLSCPNIPGSPPPAYSGEALQPYLRALQQVAASVRPRVAFGLKTPPYTHAGQFETLISSIRAVGPGCPVSFITATNTLGSCLLLSAEGPVGDSHGRFLPRLAGAGIGGMAGAPLHPLALGNVSTLRRLLDEDESTKEVQIIGIGGVEDAAGYLRMKSVGAAAVGVGTALGRKGIRVFQEIYDGCDICT